jgi:hypothetical protein
MSSPATEPRTIEYVEVPPGVGKTMWAVKKSAEILSQGQMYVIYTAPTIRVLLQFKENLKRELKEKYGIRNPSSRIRECFHMGYSGFSRSGRKRTNPMVTIEQKIALHVKGGDFIDPIKDRTVTVKPIGPGEILLMSHEGFTRMDPFIYEENTIVFFDEVNDYIVKKQKLEMNAKQVESFFELFEFDDSKSGFQRLVPLHGNNRTQRIKDYTEPIGMRRHTEFIRDLYRLSINPRIEIYLCSTRAGGLEIIEVTLPSKIFEGFRRVVILSATIRNSQLYHLLKAMGNNLVDITHKTGLIQFKNPKTGKIQPNPVYRDSVKRYEKVTIVSLTPLRGVFSQSSLDKCILNVKRLPEFHDALKKHQVDRKSLSSLRLAYDDQVRVYESLRSLGRKELAEEQKNSKEMKYLRKLIRDLENFDEQNKTNIKSFYTSPIEFYIDAADEVKRVWESRNRQHEDIPSLLFLNKKFAEDDGRGGYQISRRLVERGFNPENYQAISPKSHGSNDFLIHSVVYYLCSINMPPLTESFVRSYLPTYDSTSDLQLDNCYQCVNRSSIRDKTSDSEILFVVPNLMIAYDLHSRFASLNPNCSPPILLKDFLRDQNLDYVPFDMKEKEFDSLYRRFSSEPTKSKLGNGMASRERTANLKSVGVQISRARSYLKEAEKSSNKEKIAKAKARIEELETRRNQIKLSVM